MISAIAPQSSDSEVAQILAALKRDGVCLLKGVIPPSEVAAVRQSVRETVRQHSGRTPPLGHVSGLLRFDQSFAPYLAAPRLLAVVDRLFGEYPRISMLTGMINGPGLTRGDMHADWPFNQNQSARVRAPYPDVLMNLVTMWMLTDFTTKNGGTIVLPGSHKKDHAPRHGSGVEPTARYEGEVQLVGQAGDVGLFDARTWHAVAPNVSQDERVAFIVRYAPWWLNLQPLRPGTRDRNQMIDNGDGHGAKVEPVPLSVYDRLPPAVKPLIYHMVDESA